jgi:thiol:disulfide interchange protein DsbD
MSIGMGVPLLLIGLGAGKFMPKAGGWMNIVSRFFGVMMLAIALMMLGRILPDMINMILWSILALGSAFALFKSIKTFRTLSAKIFNYILVFALITLGFTWIFGAFNGATSLIKPFEKSVNTQTVSGKNHMGYSVNRLMNEIKEAKQPVIVDFTKESCAACKELELITFPNPAFKEAIKNYKFITVDLTANSEDDQKILAHFGIFGTPNILFFDKNGEYLSDNTITGFIAPEKMIDHIKKMENK